MRFLGAIIIWTLMSDKNLDVQAQANVQLNELTYPPAGPAGPAPLWIEAVLANITSPLTKEEEQTVCDLYTSNQTTICPTKSTTNDPICSNIASKVGGTNATCFADTICSFTKGSNTVYVTNTNCIVGYVYLRMCAFNISIIVPSKDNQPCNVTRDKEDLMAYSGAKNQGIYEEIKNCKPLTLCEGGNLTEAKSNCELVLKDEVLAKFQKDKRIGWLVGGYCIIMQDLSPPTYTAPPLGVSAAYPAANGAYGVTPTMAPKFTRCKMEGIFWNETAKKYDKFILHAFNQPGQQQVCTITYWGKERIVAINNPMATAKP